MLQDIRESNKEHRRNLERERRAKQYQHRKHLVDVVLVENMVMINFFLKKVNSPYSFSDIKKWCLRHRKTPTYKEIIDHIKSNKRSMLYKDEIYKQSSLVKYHYDMRHLYSFLPEHNKEEIRKIYKERAKTIVEVKMKELCGTI